MPLYKRCENPDCDEKMIGIMQNDEPARRRCHKCGGQGHFESGEAQRREVTKGGDDGKKA